MTADTHAAEARLILQAREIAYDQNAEAAVEALNALCDLADRLLAALSREQQRADEAERERDEYRIEADWRAQERRRAERAEAALAAEQRRREQLEAALTQIQKRQPKTLERLSRDGVVFDEQPHHDPANWQQIAFWIYTDLCEVESLASAALAAGDPEEEPQHPETTHGDGLTA